MEQLRKKMKNGVLCVMDAESKLRDSEERAHIFAEKLAGAVWNQGAEAAEILGKVMIFPRTSPLVIESCPFRGLVGLSLA